jgi:hypothetical protein
MQSAIYNHLNLSKLILRIIYAIPSASQTRLFLSLLSQDALGFPVELFRGLCSSLLHVA